MDERYAPCRCFIKTSEAMQMNEKIKEAIKSLQEWARKEYGERECVYYKRSHVWQSSRRRGSSGSFYTILERYPITKEEYDENVEAGREDANKAFYGKNNKVSYYTYHQEVKREGWQYHLAQIVQEE